jgi:twinkle protein
LRIFTQAAGCEPAVEFLCRKRLLREDVLAAFKVGVALYNFDGRQVTSVTFPWFVKDNDLPVRVKVRAIEDKRFMRLDPPGGPWGFFGWPTVSPDSEEVVLTEGELDALSVYQETGLPAISLPNGARSFPPALVEQMEQFKKIYVWCDDDVPGREGAEMCVKKLGRHRCHIVRSRSGRQNGPKDANEVLQARTALRARHAEEAAALRAEGAEADVTAAMEELRQRHAEEEAAVDMKKLIQGAEGVKHEHVLNFEAIRHEVKQEFQDFEAINGTSFGSSLPGLDKILKGHRSGELTLLTGRTGQGKTTVCAQISLDLCEQGVHTLWGSFEIRNVRLAAKMLQQHGRVSLKNCTDELFDKTADSFTTLPLWFLGYYGSTDVDEVLDAMEYAVYVHDVRHVVIDNLQFMTSREARDGDIFRILDSALHKLRQFASTFNVHITLVIHPRKDDESQLLTLSSVFGSAKATQESDNVIILQNNGIVKFLDIRKNRFDGELGFVPFEFNKKTMRFKELSKEEVDELTEASQQGLSGW